MANYVPFEQLKVGEKYYMYSTYSGKTLGQATINELYPESGRGNAYSDWGDSSGPFVFGVDDGFHNCMFWDSPPTREEVEHQRNYGVRYTPPIMVKGKAYPWNGTDISGDLAELLDKFIEKLNIVFKDDTLFGEHKLINEDKLPDDMEAPCELFITGTGACNWPIMRYVCKHGDVNIHAGERDSFGWLSGVIDKVMEDGSIRSIWYG